MSILDEVITGIQPLPRRLMIYGQRGIGKTTFAANAQDHIIIQTEEGANIEHGRRLPVANSYSKVIDTIAELYHKDHPFKTVCIDTIDWLEYLIFKQVCEDKDVKNPAEIGYGKAPEFAMDYWRTIISGLNYLRERKGMNIILIAHSMIKPYHNPETESYDRYVPKIHEKAADYISEWCDEVFFATTKILTREVDKGFNKKIHKPIDTKLRVLKTCETPTNIAKQRIHFPDEIELSYKAYYDIVQEHYRQAGVANSLNMTNQVYDKVIEDRKNSEQQAEISENLKTTNQVYDQKIKENPDQSQVTESSTQGQQSQPDSQASS